jgi:hypothetical protein
MYFYRFIGPVQRQTFTFNSAVFFGRLREYLSHAENAGLAFRQVIDKGWFTVIIPSYNRRAFTEGS